MAQIDTKKAILYLSVTFFFTVSVYVAFSSKFSEVLKNSFGGDRKVLSKITGNITGNDDTYDVVKVKEGHNITVEIYKHLPPSDVRLLNKIELPHENDGYFLFHNSSTNLALTDIDGDRLPEIIAPTFDKTLSAHLNILKYSPENQVFFHLSSPTYQND